MTGWIILLVLIAILAVIAVCKIGIHFVYAEEMATIKIVVGGIKLRVPGNKRKSNARNSSSTSVASKKKRNTKLWLSAAWENKDEILSVIVRILKAPAIDVLKVSIAVGGNDPEACALRYGKMCAVVSGVLAALENTFSIKKRKTDVWCCFDKAETEITAEAVVTLRIYEIVVLAILLLRPVIKVYHQVKNTMKVGHNT